MNPGFPDICTFISLLAMAVILAGSNSELIRSPVTIRRGVKEELPFPGVALHTRLGRRQLGLDHPIGADQVAARHEPEAKTLRHRDPELARRQRAALRGRKQRHSIIASAVPGATVAS